ncbi:hypothetical protein ACQE4V_27110, partial [Klebsiella pneumoniae]
SAQIREILINESAWEEMTCLFALSLSDTNRLNRIMDGDDLVTGFIAEIKNRFNDLDDNLANNTGSIFVDPFTGNGIPAKTSNSSITPVSNNDVVQKKVTFSTPFNF